MVLMWAVLRHHDRSGSSTQNLVCGTQGAGAVLLISHKGWRARCGWNSTTPARLRGRCDEPKTLQFRRKLVYNRLTNQQANLPETRKPRVVGMTRCFRRAALRRRAAIAPVFAWLRRSLGFPRIVPAQPDQSCDPACGFSCSSMFSRDRLTLMSPLYSMKPSCRNLFMKKLTWVRLVPIISARVS
jgi:hypothetical protein